MCRAQARGTQCSTSTSYRHKRLARHTALQRKEEGRGQVGAAGWQCVQTGGRRHDDGGVAGGDGEAQRGLGQ